jgi:peptide deformylase
MIAPIIKYGSPLLRKHSIDITGEDNPIQLSQNLFDTLKKAGGIGLAAPQTGILKRVFIIDTSPLSEDDNNIEKIEKAFFNPEITWRCDDKIYYSEGCLSIPDIFEDILRPKKIRVKYFDTNLNIIEDEFDGLIARIFQHEYDHLDGILFIDKLNPLKRKLLNGKLNIIKKLN